MFIKKLELQNFRSFEHEIIELDDITVFVGENNTGKSSIMDAIKFVIGTPSWNEGLTRYDYHLKTSKSNPGDAGELVIKVEMSENQEDEWPQEIQQTIPDVVDYDENGLLHIYLSLKGTYDQTLNKTFPVKEFTAKTGDAKSPKANTSQSFSNLRKFLPIFQIESIRNFEAEFQQKRGVFRKFLNSDKIDIEQKAKLEKSLTALNNEIIDILKNIKLLKTNLKKSMTVLSGTEEAIIDVESIPTNLDALIEKAGVIFQNATGVKLPLERQGSGALSLAVIFLYEAYLSVLIEDEFDKFATPILLIEEPEAHLHPSAVRLFWSFLEKMPGQKIISTHSGDIISKVPISKIRKIVGTTGSKRIKQVSNVSLDAKEKIKMETYIRYSRGELFFAKIWLLVEGETEQVFFDKVLNKDEFIDKHSIRIIQYQSIGIGTILKIAKDIHIPWFLITDGDRQGQGNRSNAINMLPAGIIQDDYIFSFIESSIEVYFMKNGFKQTYLSQISPQHERNITEHTNSEKYFENVYDVIKSSINKPELVMQIADEILVNNASEPSIVSTIMQKLKDISKRIL